MKNSVCIRLINRAIRNAYNYSTTRNVVFHTVAKGEVRVVLLYLKNILVYIFGVELSYLIIFIAFPFISIVEFAVTNRNYGYIILFWCLYYSFSLIMLIVLPRISWNMLYKSSKSINDMLGNKNNINLYKKHFEKLYNTNSQLIIGVTGGVIVCLLMYSLRGVLHAHAVYLYSSYIQVFTVSFFIVNAIYWIFAVPYSISAIKHIKTLKLDYIDPHRTNAIQAYSKILGRSALFSFIGLTIIPFPLVYYYFLTKDDNIRNILFIGLSVGSITVMYITFMPQYWLYRIIHKDKTQKLKELNKKIESRLTENNNDNDITAYLTLYDQLSKSKEWPINIGGLLNYLLLIITALAPIALKYI